MSMGDSFTAGFSAMANARNQKKQSDLDKMRLDFEVEQKKKELDQQKELTNRRLDFEADQAAKGREFQAGEAEKNRTFQGGESDKNRQFQATESATNRLDQNLRENRAFIANAPLNQARTNLMNAQANAMAARDPALATVELPMDPMNPNGGKITAKVPMDQIGQFQKPTATYQSPYAGAISAAEDEIAKHKMAMAQNPSDTATGPLNMWGSRNAKIADQQRKIVNLMGLELQDMVDKGLLSSDEAEARVQKIKQQYGIK